MGGSMGFLGKGVPPTQMMNMVMHSTNNSPKKLSTTSTTFTLLF
ncbi:hypothetical protein HID58_078801 [Brassica napus]|uniref:Uncharacterized protein n=1 Tax=Brassica napus TaxID=3708 RepID=A0ABQ7WZL3_BRANA|nr:hypothetical protein HID58_090564 [Brassica napus]KAH0871779.1 hypothetical protein HID58_078801 [Brassica napus]